MRTLRAIFILLGFIGFTLPLMPVQFVLRFANPRAARVFPHWYHRQLCRLLGVTIHLEGEVSDTRPTLLVSNHISWLDIPVLSAVAPVSFVAKAEVGRWPFISWLAKLQRSVFVNREQRLTAHGSANEIVSRLARGDNIVIFAEGTSSDGNQVLPFRTSLFAAVKPRKGNPPDKICVQTVAIAYTRQAGLPMCRRGRPAVAWYGDMDIAHHAWALLRRGPLDVHVHIGEPLELDSFADRKALAASTEAHIRKEVADILAPRPPPRAHERDDEADGAGVDVSADPG